MNNKLHNECVNRILIDIEYWSSIYDAHDPKNRKFFNNIIEVAIVDYIYTYYQEFNQLAYNNIKTEVLTTANI